ncbi:MAG: hypothetical protein RL199_2307, partial [Pseudomonadota bacterium]
PPRPPAKPQWLTTESHDDHSQQPPREPSTTETIHGFRRRAFFRDWLVAIRNDRSRRQRVRRNGFVTLMKDGTPVPGPFTLEAREEILVRLLSVQAEVGVELISSSELSHIKRLWAADAAAEARRSLEALQELGLAAPRSTHR